MILYLDANAIIYSMEGVEGLRRAALRWIDEAEASSEGVMITSRLSVLECRVKPLRNGDRPGLARIDGFFERETLVLADVSASVIERTAAARAVQSIAIAPGVYTETGTIAITGLDGLRIVGSAAAIGPR